MEKPTTPTGPNGSPWPEESGAEQDFGATGVFGVVKTPKPVQDQTAGSGTAPHVQGPWTPESAKQQPAQESKPLAEPVVHKVVFGGGAATSSPELLDRMRRSSAEAAAPTDKTPAPPPGDQSSMGFTQLLRTLGSDAPAPAAPATAAPAPEPAPMQPKQEMGFTSLLQTLSSSQAEAAPAAPSPGGFTELLRTMPSGDSSASAPPLQPKAPVEAPWSAGAPSTIPAPNESKPGTFTQLFRSLEGSETSAPVPPASNQNQPEPPRGNAGSFTQLLSLEAQPATLPPPFPPANKPVAGDLNYGSTPKAPAPAGSMGAPRDPFAPSSLPQAQPPQNAQPGSGVGITRLIQMLDEPSKPSAPRMEESPVSVPAGAGPGIWTQTFATLSTPNEPAVPAAKAPEWTPPPPAAPSSAAGPSEFTRILDASRMRELAMKGDPAASATPQVQPAPLPQPAIPNFSVPPPAVAMPQPGGFASPQPPQMPRYPMSYTPPAAPMGGSLPQYAPPQPPAMPAVPAPAPVKTDQAGVGKMQKYVPLLLVMVVVLLVVLLVTVIFLMKH